ncbi:NifB/NifX family molybdenum-iron cluster-binding protein [Thermodesulfatator atlanticus]|uniref:NifB/NifX family molybdenum-iron cluster-binding protein n=1 Tax=Thermodesulfatator atlanticus TaxID=501497 RepID=UPI0003B3BD20|nr:NifB/NifX family molybdenum-iron cluster-binding protein [Thermodesulfatator atlanticus]
MKIAVPIEGEMVAEHFGHAPQFAIYEVDGDGIRKEIHVPPPHEPGVIPQWLASLGVNCILCGMLGRRAIGYFEEYGIKVVSGVPAMPADEAVAAFVAGTLRVSPRLCGGGHGHGGCGRH